ncbi:hypothetical protein R1479_03578 [Ralstonia mannitolilytica]|uniref:alkaline phosphatase family protein n=1 Tax=Ralstonia mannitolilytica TaxID=105219 RepID=UPI0028F511B7|nr:alkaline phosphatase family protein [Ralstonia mannitolilytica]CAJ0710965.1 hypothetical protein LMG8323_01395 [Ralstonia mannitolilytica]CAJ0891216.1 hypothetical protein R1479_03578 [Ralstonia mannitolilytica]
MAWNRPARRLLTAALGTTLAAALAACGGGSDGTPIAGQGDTSPPPAGTSRKVLVVGVDGATYAQLQRGLLQRRLPNLAALAVMPASTGGTLGTTTAQPPLDTPSWATVLTGAWQNRHGVTDDTVTTLAAPTVFGYARSAAKAAGTTQHLGAAVSSAVLPALLRADQQAGNLDTLVDCAQADPCVTQHSVKLVQSGYDVVFAQYSAPAAAALDAGLQSDAYTAALHDVDQAIGTLQAAIAQRRAANPSEDWLVVVTTSHGLDVTGATTSAPTLENRTAFIALNKTANPVLGKDGTAAPTSEATLAALPSEADIVPTVLAQLNAAVPAATHKLDGAALTANAVGVRNIQSTVGQYNASLVLTWQNPTTASGPVTVLRDGKPVATLPATATQYADNSFATATGLYRINYTVVRNDVPVSTLAQIDYVAPTPLAATLTNGLAAYYSFDPLPPADRKASSTIGPWVPGADGGSAATDPFGGTALSVDSRVDSYKLTQNGADIALSPQFTIGFWFKSDCTQGNGTGEPILSNKNYTSGANAGIAFGLFGGCEVRFNLGSGGKRDDINGMKFSANQWAYLALSVDTQAKRFSAYILDPVLGVQKVEDKAIANTDVTKLGGLATKVWGLNDDATHNYVPNNPGSLKGVMAYDDLAMWTRRLTLDELKTINGSHQPLSSLNP